MKALLNFFFCTLGVVFFILICVGLYLWFADPFNLRPLVSLLFANTLSREEVRDGVGVPSPGVQNSDESVGDRHPLLSTEQEEALTNAGIDPRKLPTTITPDMETCFSAVLGDARVAEIKAGATPSAQEFWDGRACLEE